jgi:hypothetical protein
MSQTIVIKGLHDEDNDPIVSMGSSFISKSYQFGSNLHLGVHMFWDQPVTGTLFLEYSCDPVDSDGVQNWVVKNEIPVTTADQSQMILDANVPVVSFRIRFVRVSGSAALSSYVILKTGGA